MYKSFNRRKFLQLGSIIATGATTIYPLSRSFAFPVPADGGRIGIIGLDTSHSVAFTKALNGQRSAKYLGFKVVAAYPNGSKDIESSVKRIPGYIEEVKKFDVEIVTSIDELLTKVDFVLLETNDGRPHLEQGLQVMRAGKTLFIDKPVAASLTDVIALYDASAKFKVPFFSSSSLRYMESAQEVRAGSIGKVLGADTFSPATIEKTHPDLFWYGIHGIETLFTVMGVGCKEVQRIGNNDSDIVTGIWNDERIGTFRGTRTGKHEYGGTAYGEKGNKILGPYKGYDNLLDQIIDFFRSGKVPVSPEETIEIYTFMEAADESKRRGGKRVSTDEIYQKHLKQYQKIKNKLNLPQ